MFIRVTANEYNEHECVLDVNAADEGLGLRPPLQSTEQICSALQKALDKVGIDWAGKVRCEVYLDDDAVTFHLLRDNENDRVNVALVLDKYSS